MSTYSHLSVMKINAAKSMKQRGIRKNTSPVCGIVKVLHTANNKCSHIWYSNNTYPVLEDEWETTTGICAVHTAV